MRENAHLFSSFVKIDSAGYVRESATYTSYHFDQEVVDSFVVVGLEALYS